MALTASRKTGDAKPTRWEQALSQVAEFSRQDEEQRLRTIDAALATVRGMVEAPPSAQDGGGRLLNWKGRLAWTLLGAARVQEARDQIASAAGLLDEKALLGLADAAKVVATRLGQLRDATDLLGEITSASYEFPPKCDCHYREFESLLRGEYAQLAREDDYPAEAEADGKLEDVLERMRRIRLAPRIASRTICAVAGGFSSGKSSFLNSLMGTKNLLPTRITPTTAFPTFLLSSKGSEQTINVFNHDGGSVHVEPEALQQMTHDFKREYGVQLKRLVERVSIYTPRLAKWNKVALIDTPGYTNPDDADGAGSDEEAALRSIWDSQFLIWLVECERGTLPERDVGLLRRILQHQGLAEGREVIYLVLNKADKKPEEQREDILKQVVQTAQRQEIPCFGVGLYSAHRGEWYGCHGRPFAEFMQELNEAEAVNVEALQDDVVEVFAGYAAYHAAERKRVEDALRLMERLGRERSESNPEPEDSGLEEEEESGIGSSLNAHIRALRKALVQQSSWAERAVVLEGKFLRSINGFIREVNALRDAHE